MFYVPFPRNSLFTPGFSVCATDSSLLLAFNTRLTPSSSTPTPVRIVALKTLSKSSSALCINLAYGFLWHSRISSRDTIQASAIASPFNLEFCILSREMAHQFGLHNRLLKPRPDAISCSSLVAGKNEPPRSPLSDCSCHGIIKAPEV